jgi:hypothetical protein
MSFIHISLEVNLPNSAGAPASGPAGMYHKFVDLLTKVTGGYRRLLIGSL